ncbi:TauD/TfdA family dioxygenase, partial [Erwinia sp. OLMTSP26]|uniref:TauD/TfdA family dioxygenase n=1 Tax=Erwinia sp. OLMTSP26 TaxID=1912595 RepID=UPI001F5337CE
PPEAQISGADLTRPLSDNQFEQLYHAVLRHQVVFLRDQTITPQQQRALAQGLLLLTCGAYGNVIRFLYPLTIPDAQFDAAMKILQDALSD